MSYLRFIPILLLPAYLMAIPYQVKTIREGSGDPVKKGQLIKVNYKGWLTDSTLFDDSYARGEPLEFSLGSGQVISGWDRGLEGIKVGEIRRLALPSELAYGDRAVGPIPANSDLYFEVELVSAQPPLPQDTFPDIRNIKWKETAPGLALFDAKPGTGTGAVPGMRIKLHYTGWLSQGTKFGSSKDLGKPFEVILGTGRLIKGWEQGLEGLAPQGVRYLRVSPSMGYGAAAYASIPPNSTLIFRIEMLSADADSTLAETMDFFPDTSELTLKDGPEGLRYAVLREGDSTREAAVTGDSVRVHYTGYLTNGTKFDSSRDRGEIFAFPLGGGRVIRGWDLGVAGMYPGEKRVLIVPPGLGYGNRNAGPIPGNSTLIFIIEYLGK